VEPVPATARALQHLADRGETGLGEELARMARVVSRLVPSCVGLSLGVVREGLTFTLVATDEETARLDAVQYLGGGPCVEATESTREAITTSPDQLLDEDRWQLFARASAGALVQSTLSLPVGDESGVVAGVNLYAAAPDAFAGLHEELAEVLGAWAPGIVTNADLSFLTLDSAQQAPHSLEARRAVDLAVGILAEAQGMSTDEAASRLTQAAARAGIAEDRVADVIRTILLEE
jgi:transcriptional regulator with GAF, ATPase, and Fis domain